MYIQINVHVKCYRQQAFGTLFRSALLENIRGGKNRVDTNELHNWIFWDPLGLVLLSIASISYQNGGKCELWCLECTTGYFEIKWYRRILVVLCAILQGQIWAFWDFWTSYTLLQSHFSQSFDVQWKMEIFYGYLLFKICF